MDWVCEDSGFSLDDLYGGVENEMIAEWNAPPGQRGEDDDEDGPQDDDEDEPRELIHRIDLGDGCEHRVALEYGIGAEPVD
jgi:hypothetical protein